MRTKDNTVIMDLTPEMMDGTFIVEQVLNKEGIELVVTSARDSDAHMTGSKHYEGNAIDVRTWYITDRFFMAAKLRAALGDDFDVVVEATHIHVEYDPK